MPTVQKDSAVLLCIDSNLDVLGCEKAFLEAFGYTVLTAPSDSKGLELASVHSVDVVIVDYFMPEMNGQEFAIRMRRLKPKAPIIMLSAAVDVPKQALKLVNAFVQKDQLASHLLPAIAQLQESQSISTRSYGQRRAPSRKVMCNLDQTTPPRTPNTR
ncbi:MAG: response regulator [Terriglobales bacterium]|jgi:CheY-like chemotaxis protein